MSHIPQESMTLEWEAPRPAIALLHAALLDLGANAAEAKEAARTGRFVLEGLAFGVACDQTGDDEEDAEAFIVAADLGEGLLDTPEQRRRVLLANTELLAFVGVALAGDRGQARLVSRWQLADQTVGDFATWLRDVARLGAAIVEQCRNSAPTLVI